MTKSVWYEMGMRDGAFALTNPATFMDRVSNFFAELYYQSYLSINPDHEMGDAEKEDRYFSFDLRDKWGAWSGTNAIYGSRLTIRNNRFPFGTYMPEEMWSAPQPEVWEKTSFTEEEILQEKLILHPGDRRRDGIGDRECSLHISLDPEWGAQRYRLIQKMRYCFIPLCSAVTVGGFLRDDVLSWMGMRKITFRIPDYWRAEGTVHKIAVYMKNRFPDYDWIETPPDTCKWVTDGEFIIPERADGEVWEGSSRVQFYGCVDLATHPDFAKYFDIETNETT